MKRRQRKSRKNFKSSLQKCCLDLMTFSVVAQPSASGPATCCRITLSKYCRSRLQTECFCSQSTVALYFNNDTRTGAYHCAMQLNIRSRTGTYHCAIQRDSHRRTGTYHCAIQRFKELGHITAPYNGTFTEELGLITALHNIQRTGTYHCAIQHSKNWDISLLHTTGHSQD